MPGKGGGKAKDVQWANARFGQLFGSFFMVRAVTPRPVRPQKETKPQNETDVARNSLNCIGYNKNSLLKVEFVSGGNRIRAGKPPHGAIFWAAMSIGDRRLKWPRLSPRGGRMCAIRCASSPISIRPGDPSNTGDVIRSTRRPVTGRQLYPNGWRVVCESQLTGKQIFNFPASPSTMQERRVG